MYRNRKLADARSIAGSEIAVAPFFKQSVKITSVVRAAIPERKKYHWTVKMKRIARRENK